MPISAYCGGSRHCGALRRLLRSAALPVVLALPVLLASLLPSACRAEAAQHPAIRSVEHGVCEASASRPMVSPTSPVRCDQLAVVRFTYTGFDGRIHHDGEVMVLAAAAKHVRAIFAALHARRFPIARARLIEAYGDDDAASMRDNNTSAFNDRPVTGGGPPSLHAYGLAIDLNPEQNPYVRFDGEGRAVFEPPAGSRYANRRDPRPGKAPRRGMAEEAVQLFAVHGFTVWGGDWDTPIDYQHFQVRRDIAEKLASLPAGEGRLYYDQYVGRLNACLRKQGRRGWAAALQRCADHSGQ